MSFKRRTDGYRPELIDYYRGMTRPIVAVSLSLCLLIGSGGNALTPGACAADSTFPEDSPAKAAAEGKSDTGSTTPAPEPATAGSAQLKAKPEKLELPQETTGGGTEEKSKKKSSSRSRSSRSKSRASESSSPPSEKEPTKADEGGTPAEVSSPEEVKQSQSSEPAQATAGESTSRSRRSGSKSKKDREAAADSSGADEKKTGSNRSRRSKSKGSDTASDTAKKSRPGDAREAAPPQARELMPQERGEEQPPSASETTPPPEPTAQEGEPEEQTIESEARPEGNPATKKRSDDDTASDTEDSSAPKKKRSATLAEADEFLLKGKYEAAEESYRGLLNEDETGDAYAGLAVALAKQINAPKKVLEAEKLMKKSREQFSDNPNIVAAAGYVSYAHSKSVASPAKRDQYLEAAENLSRRAVKYSPDTIIAQQTLGLVKLAQDDPEGAIPPLKKALRQTEDNYTKTLLAEALLKVDPRDDDAKALIDDVLSTDSKYHAARLQKAFYLTNKGKHEEAYTELHTLPRAERSGPLGSDWHKIQGDIFKAQGDGPSALASWKEANRLDPRNPEPYKQLAHYYSMRGDGELAIAEYHTALEILPNDLRMRAELAELALRQDKLEVAETEYRTILSAKDNDPASLLGLSRVFFRKARRDGQYPSGWTELMDKVTSIVTEQNVSGQVIKKGAKNLTEKIQLSEAEKALAESPPRFREARQLFSQVITAHREEPYELLSLGDQAYNDGDLKSAEEAFGYAKEINEVAPRADQGISRIVSQRNEAKRHTELGNATWKLPEIAIDHYRQALIADPQHPDAYYGLYKLYYKLKKDDSKAIDYAHTYLEASDDNDPLRKEVQDDLFRLKKRVQK